MICAGIIKQNRRTNRHPPPYCIHAVIGDQQAIYLLFIYLFILLLVLLLLLLLLFFLHLFKVPLSALLIRKGASVLCV